MKKEKMKWLIFIMFLLSIKNIGNATVIRSYSCSQMIGYSDFIAEGEIIEVDSLFFKFRINQVFKGKIKNKEILVGKNLENDRYRLYRNRYDFWKKGQREIIFLNPEYDLLGEKFSNIFSLANHNGDSEIPIINDTIYLAKWFGNHSKNWNKKYVDYSLGKYYHLPEISKRFKLGVNDFFQALKFCTKNNRKIIRKCRRDRFKNQVEKVIETNSTKYRTSNWIGIIDSKWMKKKQSINKAYERLIDEYYDGFVDLHPMKWNKKTHIANTGLFIKLE